VEAITEDVEGDDGKLSAFCIFRIVVYHDLVC